MSTLVVSPQPAEEFSLLEELCEIPELLEYLLGFLVLYEQLNLGRVSKKVKNVCYGVLGYDPFAGDRWMSLGDQDFSLGYRLSVSTIFHLKQLQHSLT